MCLQTSCETESRGLTDPDEMECEQMTGKIIKGISGFYYIHTPEGVIYASRAVGIFRKLGIKPLVGDNVEFEVTDETDLEGSLTKIRERKNVLIRPAVANIDQAMVVFAIREPDLNLNLLDRFLIYMEQQDLPVTIFFNKSDLDRDGLMDYCRRVYEAAGYRVICGSTGNEEDIDRIREALKGKTTVLAGPSGAGKSSLTNKLNDGVCMEVGELSAKIRRGKQTTRHTELFTIDADSYVLDTPGFTSLFVNGIEARDLEYYFPEFRPYIGKCKFTVCSHIYEAEELCAVRRAVSAGDIDSGRYQNYCQIYGELKDKAYR